MLPNLFIRGFSRTANWTANWNFDRGSEIVSGYSIRISSGKMFLRAKATAIGKALYSTLSSSTRIGIVGVGNVGKAIANNLSDSSMRLHAAFDISADSLQSLPDEVILTSSPKELAECCDVVLTALPTPAAVKAAMLGDDGVLAGIRKGCTWIDHSTTGL